MFLSQTCELKDTEFHRSNPCFESLAEEFSTAQLTCNRSSQGSAKRSELRAATRNSPTFLHLFAGLLRALSSNNLEIACAPVVSTFVKG